MNKKTLILLVCIIISLVLISGFLIIDNENKKNKNKKSNIEIEIINFEEGKKYRISEDSIQAELESKDLQIKILKEEYQKLWEKYINTPRCKIIHTPLV